MSPMTNFEVHAGEGEKQVTIHVDIDPAVVAKVMADHPPSHDEQRADEALGKSTHLVSVDVTGLTLAEVHSKVGTTEFLPSLNVSLVPGDVKNELQGQVHADIIKESWAQIGGVTVTSGIGTELDYQHSNGMAAKLDLNNEVRFKSATFTATVTTDLSGPQPHVEAVVGLKFTL
jgi:hypothetical protein